MGRLVARAPKVRHDLCQPFRPQGYQELAFPVLTDGAIDLGSFGPKHAGETLAVPGKSFTFPYNFSSATVRGMPCRSL